VGNREDILSIHILGREIAATGAVIRHGGRMAYYAPGSDVIQLPVPETFRDAERYAATKAHGSLNGRNIQPVSSVLAR
jgi:antirestriction protein ArdC